MSNTGIGGPLQVHSKDGTTTSEVHLVSGDPMNPVINVKIQGVANAAGGNIATFVNASMGQPTTFTFPDPGATSASIMLGKSASAANAPSMITRVVSVGQAAVAAAGKVVVQAHTSATSQFGVYSMRVIKSTGLSGNSGDRLMALGDGTLVFNGSGITAAVLGTPITTRPGGTGNPDCGTAVDPTASTAGADIYLQYTGGTTDYNAGSVKIEVVLYQVTA